MRWIVAKMKYSTSLKEKERTSELNYCCSLWSTLLLGAVPFSASSLDWRRGGKKTPAGFFFNPSGPHHALWLSNLETCLVNCTKKTSPSLYTLFLSTVSLICTFSLQVKSLCSTISSWGKNKLYNAPRSTHGHQTAQRKGKVLRHCLRLFNSLTLRIYELKDSTGELVVWLATYLGKCCSRANKLLCWYLLFVKIWLRNAEREFIASLWSSSFTLSFTGE